MAERINKVYELMEREGIDGLVIDSRENRFYLTGFTGTAGKVLFTPKASYFLVDFRYTEQANTQAVGYQVMEVNEKLDEKIAATCEQDGVTRLGFEAKVVSFDQAEKYQEQLTNMELRPTRDLISELRMIKDPAEVEKIRKAIEITDRAFDHICGYLKPGIMEREVALELEYFMKKQGAEKNSFDFIVASGWRSSMPHGVASEKKIEKGELLTMDFGTFYQGYCSDLTRTVVIGKADDKQKEIYNLVLKAQLEVIERIRAGMSCNEADAIARDIIYQAGYEGKFGHGLGHGIGVEIHEGPRVSYHSDQVLKPGMVVTDEPGIYLPGWGGVRIEDDLLITENGCQVLNKSPKELIEL